MKLTKDGDVRRYAADAGKGRSRAQFHGRQIACLIAVMAFARFLAFGPQACGDKCARASANEPARPLIADQAMSLNSVEPYDVDPPSPDNSATANGAFAPRDELEPEGPKAMHPPLWEAPLAYDDIHCELRELEALLASGAYFDPHRPYPQLERFPCQWTSRRELTWLCTAQLATGTSSIHLGTALNRPDTQTYGPLYEYVEAASPESEIEATPQETEVEAAVLQSEVEPLAERVAAVAPPCDEMADATESQVEALVLQNEVETDATKSDAKADRQESEIEAVVLKDDVVADVPRDGEGDRGGSLNGSDAKKTDPDVTSGEAVVPHSNIEVDAPRSELSFDKQESAINVDAQESGALHESHDEAAEEEADDDPPRKESPPIPTKGTSPSPAPISGDIIASVSILSDNARLITVARNSSAAIDLKMDCDRAEIADPNIADIVVISPKRVIVSGKTFGTTQMILRVGQQQKVFNVSVEHDLSLLTDAIRSISPTANVQPRSVNGTIVLSGTVPDSQTGERIAEMASLFQTGQVRNQLTVAGVQQTMLRVVVAEVNKEAVRQLGFNWAIGGGDWTRDFFFANNVGGLNPTVFTSNGSTNIGGSPTPQITYSVFPVGNGPGTNLTFGFPRAEFQVFMQALRQNSLARVLAEPNLVAISGQTATFLAGGEVPIPVTQGGAVAGSITIEYKEFGIRLAFTPTVLAGQIVRLHVMSEVSDAIPGTTIAGGLPVFSFLTRRVESTVECGNGQTFAMAGLLNERVRAVARKFPGLGDVPVLGALFSSVEYQKDNTELVVLVTPQLVEPLDPQQVPPPPGSLMTSPSDYELFALGQLEGQPNEAPTYEGVPRDHAPVNTPPPGQGSGVRGQGSGPQASSVYALRGPWGLADIDEN